MISDRVLDLGLMVLVVDTTALHICGSLPVDYAQVSESSLGVKSAPIVAGPQNWTSGGRRVTVQAFSDGLVQSNGQATHWAIVDDTNERLLAAFTLLVPKNVTTPNNFSLPDFDIAIPYEPQP